MIKTIIYMIDLYIISIKLFINGNFIEKNNTPTEINV